MLNSSSNFQKKHLLSSQARSTRLRLCKFQTFISAVMGDDHRQRRRPRSLWSLLFLFLVSFLLVFKAPPSIPTNATSRARPSISTSPLAVSPGVIVGHNQIANPGGRVIHQFLSPFSDSLGSTTTNSETRSSLSPSVPSSLYSPFVTTMLHWLISNLLKTTTDYPRLEIGTLLLNLVKSGLEPLINERLWLNQHRSNGVLVSGVRFAVFPGEKYRHFNPLHPHTLLFRYLLERVQRCCGRKDSQISRPRPPPHPDGSSRTSPPTSRIIHRELAAFSTRQFVSVSVSSKDLEEVFSSRSHSANSMLFKSRTNAVGIIGIASKSYRRSKGGAKEEVKIRVTNIFIGLKPIELYWLMDPGTHYFSLQNSLDSLGFKFKTWAVISVRGHILFSFNCNSGKIREVDRGRRHAYIETFM